MNLARETNRLCRTDCVSVRKRRLRRSGHVVRAKQPELESSVGTANNNKSFWGKKREAAWQCRLRDHGGESDVPRVVEKAEDGSLRFLVHPVAHLAWTSLRRKGNGGQSAAQAPDGSMHDGPPPVCDFGVANSAMCTMALPVNWAEVEHLAAVMEASPSSSTLHSAPGIGPAAAQASLAHHAAPIAEVFHRPENGWWQVADKTSLELVLAHALLDKPVVVTCLSGINSSKDCLGVELDRTKLWYEDDNLLYGIADDGAAATNSSTVATEDHNCSLHNCEDPNEVISKAVSNMRKVPGSSSKISCICDPVEVAHTRWAEACCWPKVWALRQVLVEHDDQAWDQALTDQGIGLGSVPIKWSAERNSWTAGNRHRVVASLLTGRQFQATFKLKQVVEWEWREEHHQGPNSEPGRKVKWPSKLWQPKLTE